jgi:hypothetical protein
MPLLNLDDLYRAMVVAVAIVYMVQMAVYQVIHMVAVRHHFMPAVLIMPAAAGNRVMLGRILIVYLNFTFVPVPIMFMVQVAVVYIIYMVVVPYFGMPAGNTMLVGMILVLVVFGILIFHFLIHFKPNKLITSTHPDGSKKKELARPALFLDYKACI